ncbi:Protein of unknown function [Pyronema omphalodes CBS 100304]|uniref:Uncharacterized protein n=1 Tax=Pyronema omphalodes (strain CBS 100304) TaxID=1076935 RepID=U4L7K3_PYROM|nr:Protein of unknown function [Pyronema omphalodes CBS 100304]
MSRSRQSLPRPGRRLSFTRNYRPVKSVHNADHVRTTEHKYSPTSEYSSTPEKSYPHNHPPFEYSSTSDESSLSGCVYSFGHLQLQRRVSFDLPKLTHKQKALNLLTGKVVNKNYKKARAVVFRTANRIVASEIYMNGFAPTTAGLLTRQIEYYRRQIPQVEEVLYKIAARAEEWCKSPLDHANHDIRVRMQKDIDRLAPVFDSWLSAINEITIGIYQLRVKLEDLVCHANIKKKVEVQLELLFEELETLKANRNGGREWMELWNRKMTQCWLQEKREMRQLAKLEAVEMQEIKPQDEKKTDVLKVEEFKSR